MNANQAPSRVFFGWWVVMSISLLVIASLVSLRLDERPRTVPALSPVPGR